MKIDFSKDILDLDGKPTELKLDAVSKTALLASYPDEQNLSGDEKVKRFQLALKIAPKEVDVSVEDAALIKKLIAKGYATLVTARAWEILEG